MERICGFGFGPGGGAKGQIGTGFAGPSGHGIRIVCSVRSDMRLWKLSNYRSYRTW